MNNYVCGVKLQAENPEGALNQSLPIPKLINTIMISEDISCIESPGVGIEFLGWFLPVSFILFVLLGFLLGRKFKDDKRRPAYLCDNPDH